MFTQLIDPLGNLSLTCLVALIPVVFLLVMLAVFRAPAWVATLAGSAVTFVLAVWVWKMPADVGGQAYLYGAATGMWNVNWITFWGLILFNTLSATGLFENFRRWLIAQGSLDVRVQTMLFAWAFGALLEGLVGFGYPWAVVAPILISLGISDLNAIRVAAIANNAPVSYGALGAPIISLAAVTGYPLLSLSGSVGFVVAILALLPPWVLLYLVSGRQGMLSAWPLAIVGSLGYIAGQYPVAKYMGPYLPDVTGAIVCFAALLLLLKFWQPKTVLGYGGVPVPATKLAGATRDHGLTPAEVVQAWMPFAILLVVVAAWTGPWSSLPKVSWFLAKVSANAPEIKTTITAQFNFAPWIGGTSILAAWILVAAWLFAAGKLDGKTLGAIFRKTFAQMWGALLVGIFIFGLAYVFNFSGMASSLAKGFSSLGTAFVIVSPILGFIGVALSGSNTSTNAMFGKFQALVGNALGMPALLLPTFNSVGAEIGKPVAPQTASVGVSTSQFVRREGDVIRHNMGWTFALLAYLIVIAVALYLLQPASMILPPAP
ncbi:MAG: L-lactate permease [Rudaea sp.]|uniref:L-lactate permease n=1 Tax=unclassified Rudaea TaxID=2627037 RepID=UPI0010F56C20|nr:MULTISPECIES: L-lactate permease [unclassified Rudaea]MBN8885387.1 L-lactate permease [Rudaea sp.]MBR0347381.1 L-lactate permease [Rudaea sp.]